MGSELPSDLKLSRRNFLGYAWGAALVGLVGQGLFAFLQFFKPRLDEGAFGSRVRVGAIEDIPVGSVTHVSKGRFYISRLEDGGLLALWHRCTHLGCTVPWREEEGSFRCPCHSSVFNRRGEVVDGPAPRPLDLFAIEIEDGEVIVDTGQPVTRDVFDASQEAHG